LPTDSTLANGGNGKKGSIMAWIKAGQYRINLDHIVAVRETEPNSLRITATGVEFFFAGDQDRPAPTAFVIKLQGDEAEQFLTQFGRLAGV
jgi:hypothetical protein